MLLELKNVRKYFALPKKNFLEPTSFVKAVDGVSLSLKAGENMSLVGESGCGKSTLAKLILKLMPMDSGSLLYEGQDITNFDNRRMKVYRKAMQIVFQDPYSSLDPRFTVRRSFAEALNLEAQYYASFDKRETRLGEVMTAVQLNKDMLNRYPHEFSGGERQRIAIARAVILNPKLLVLDEAVSSLDVLIQEQLINLLLDLQQRYKMTYLFVSHNLKVVRKISQRVAVMYQGKIVELASTEEIFNRPLHPYTQELLSAAINYKASPREEPIPINANAELTDQGNSHFVLS